MEVSKRDRKLFQENIGDWQESYIEKLNAEYIKILEGMGNPSEKFWQLEKRIKADKKHCGVLIEMRKPNLLKIILTSSVFCMHHFPPNVHFNLIFTVLYNNCYFSICCVC